MKSALVLVTHDRHALDRLTTAVGPSRVVELDGGRCFVHHAVAGSSAYATYLDARAERIEREAKEESTRKILARRELAWLRRGAPARSTKPKARLRTAHEIVGGGPAPVGVRGHDLELGAGTKRLGNQVVELEGVAQRFGDHTVFRGRRPDDRTRCPSGDRRPERVGEVDAARRRGRPAPAGRRHGEAGLDGGRRVRRSALVRPRPERHRPQARRRSRTASPTSRTGRCSNGSGSTPPRSTRRCACCRVASVAVCNS